MKNLCIAVFLLFVTELSATTYYVALDGSSTSPYDTWAKAATQLQVAIDAAAPGDTVLVSNGLYNSGGRPCYGTLTNRVVITNNITLLSVNGPAVTTIEGAGSGGTTNLGLDAIRCLFMSNGIISGFTLSNGYTYANSNTPEDLNRRGGGAILYGNAMATNLIITHCKCGGNWGGGGGVASYSTNWIIDSTIQHCSCTGTYSATATGGGAAFGFYDNVCVKHCYSQSGGSGIAYPSVVKNSSIVSNYYLTNSTMQYYGGAILLTMGSVVTNSEVEWNRMEGGGGITLGNSNIVVIATRIMYNVSVAYAGGGVAVRPTAKSSFLYACVVSKNSSLAGEGGAIYCEKTMAQPLSLVNCVIYSNFSASGASSAYATLTNCILWGNSTSNLSLSTNSQASYCLEQDPFFVDADSGDYHLKSKAGTWSDTSESWTNYSVHSPAIDAGDPTSVWTNEPSPNGGRINVGLYGNTPYASKSWEETAVSSFRLALYVLDKLILSE